MTAAADLFELAQHGATTETRKAAAEALAAGASSMGPVEVPLEAAYALFRVTASEAERVQATLLGQPLPFSGPKNVGITLGLADRNDASTLATIRACALANDDADVRRNAMATLRWRANGEQPQLSSIDTREWTPRGPDRAAREVALVTLSVAIRSDREDRNRIYAIDLLLAASFAPSNFRSRLDWLKPGPKQRVLKLLGETR